MRNMSRWRKIGRYMILPEDTTGVISQDERAGYMLIHNLPPCLGFIKGIFWLIIAIITPLVVPVLLRVLAGN